MPPTLTNRELKNKSTGIDIIVPEFQVIPGKIVNTVLYHVIVITRLFYFKTRKHKESDLVQFAVAKKYEEVEDLYSKLVSKFPSVNFPSLPRMSLIITEKTLNERKNFLEQLLNLVARTPKLCSSTSVLTFLEASKISIKQNQLQKPEPEKPEKDEEEKKENKEEVDCDIFGVTQYDESDEESDSTSASEHEEDVAVVDMKRPSDPEPSNGQPFVGTKEQPIASDNGAAATLVPGKQEEQAADMFLKSSGKFSFGSHDTNEHDISDLFIPDEAKKFGDVNLFVSEDDPDLLDIDDDLDKLLNVSKKKAKPAPSPKPRTSARPDLKPRPTPKPRFVESTDDADIEFLSEPGKPTKADETTKPEKPVKPEKPIKPEKQVKPEKPLKPEKPVRPEKPVKPEKPAKPEKPVKPETPVKSVGPPKPKPRTRSKKEKSERKEKSVPGEITQGTKAETLDDIFGKPSKTDLFSGIDDDEEDLFKPAQPEDIDDITKYIEKNIGNIGNEEVDLFS